MRAPQQCAPRQRPTQTFGGGDQHGVADSVPECIVDTLELVDVGRKNAERGILCFGFVEQSRQVLAQADPVRQTSERIGARGRRCLCLTRQEAFCLPVAPEDEEQGERRQHAERDGEPRRHPPHEFEPGAVLAPGEEANRSAVQRLYLLAHVAGWRSVCRPLHVAKAEVFAEPFGERLVQVFDRHNSIGSPVTTARWPRSGSMVEMMTVAGRP